MNPRASKPYFALLFAWFFLFMGCSGKKADNELLPSTRETIILLRYLEENGDVVNSEQIPTMVSAEDVFENLHAANQLVIDLRTAEEYSAGQILHSINVASADILDYFEQSIEPNSFDNIVLVCQDAMFSGYVCAILQMLGYDNVVFLRNGLCSWNMDIATKYWLGGMNSHMEGKLETTPNPKPAPGSLPAISTGKTSGYDILRARAADILNLTREDIIAQADSVLNAPEKHFIINYWPKDLYEQGHITGSVQYDPKSSLHSEKDLVTLPTDKPVVVYCYSGHHSTYPVAMLRLLGYDARHIPYGVNAFIQQTMLDTQPISRSFNESMVRNFPLSGSEQGTMSPQTEIKTKEITVQGGC